MAGPALQVNGLDCSSGFELEETDSQITGVDWRADISVRRLLGSGNTDPRDLTERGSRNIMCSSA